MKILISVLISILVASGNMLFGSEITFAKNIGWVSNRDLTEEEFDEKYTIYKNADYIMTDIDVYETSAGLRYSMIWQRNTDNRVWMQYKAIFEREIDDLIKFLKLSNFRLTDLEMYKVDGKIQYAAIFVKNVENLEWDYRLDQSKTSFQNYARYKIQKEFQNSDLEIQSTNSGLRFASVWVKYPVPSRRKLYFDMSYSEFQQKVQYENSRGWLLTNYEPYQDGNSTKYAITMEKHEAYSGVSKTNLTELQFANWWRTYSDMGYRLIDFECVKTSSGQRYAGVWIDCDERFGFSEKEALDSLIKQYKKDNNLPGISVAIIKNGVMVYRRGFGYSDIENGKVAHGETVYLAASVSKVISGTLAVKLQDEGRLRDGQVVRLNLNNTTRSYLTNVRKSDNTLVTLPAAHTHTVAQLYAHLGCINHYDGPEPSIRQYSKAIDALTQIWDPNKAIISNCTINADTIHYSTHAQTYLAAVLEKVSGKSASELIRSEIAEPYGLRTLRAQYATANLLPDYDRAIPYKRAWRFDYSTQDPIPPFGPPPPTAEEYNKDISYENNSWKIFGGGIEVSAVDLARFGWKVLDGQIVNATARDNVLWQRVNSDSTCGGCNYGIGWGVFNPGINTIALHTGSQDGARSMIKIYKRDDLVIAIMSNREDHYATDVSALANNIKNLL